MSLFAPQTVSLKLRLSMSPKIGPESLEDSKTHAWLTHCSLPSSKQLKINFAAISIYLLAHCVTYNDMTTLIKRVKSDTEFYSFGLCYEKTDH